MTSAHDVIGVVETPTHASHIGVCTDANCGIPFRGCIDAHEAARAMIESRVCDCLRLGGISDCEVTNVLRARADPFAQETRARAAAAGFDPRAGAGPIRATSLLHVPTGNRYFGDLVREVSKNSSLTQLAVEIEIDCAPTDFSARRDV